MNLYLENSGYEGAINSDGQAGDIYVELDENSTWKLTGDSYIKGLSCDEDAIDLNGYTLYINGEEYKEGTKSEGTAVEIVTESGGSMPDGEPPEGMGDHEPPEKPDGEEPPKKPEE